MSDMVLLGDEALAMGALHGGISVAYGYPGTPSTEIIEFLERYIDEGEGSPHISWCANEKTSYEAALGASLVGKRVLVTMKHVGLNVAMDPFVNSALCRMGGGLVLAVADDPGMHSSQDEQDSRLLADFAKIICLEPRNQQETYEMTREAFDLSEKFGVPVMIRLVTRLAHSRAVVHLGESRSQNELKKAENPAEWMLLPALARKNWASLLNRQKDFLKYTEGCSHNPMEVHYAEKGIGVITTGLGRNYFEENLADLPEKPSHLHISAYPIPEEKVRKFCGQMSKVVVIEEGVPYVERLLRGLLPDKDLFIAGKMDGQIPLTGELNPDNVRHALGLSPRKSLEMATDLPGRPPQLCQGCPHADTYEAINEARRGYENSLVTSDIGCYALGALPPYKAIETIVCMGASVGMARGAADNGLHPVVGVIGDSTFLHSGVTGLIDAVSGNANITLVIVDNSTVAMTGGQKTIIPSSSLEAVVRGIGVDPDHLRTIVPLKKNLEENVRVIKEEMDHKGVSVVISLRECIETAKRKKKNGGKA